MDFLTAYLKANFDALRLVASVTALAVLYPVGLSIYRLTFDPLAKFPGPKIAATTSWYEFYYDWWCEGRYVFEIEKMHKQYGLWTLEGQRSGSIRGEVGSDYAPNRSDRASESSRVINSRPSRLQ